jgi:hypothetical protein
MAVKVNVFALPGVGIKGEIFRHFSLVSVVRYSFLKKKLILGSC